MKKGLVVAVVLASLAGCDAPTYFRTEVPENPYSSMKTEDAVGVALDMLRQNGYTIGSCSLSSVESEGEGYIEATKDGVRTRIDVRKKGRAFSYEVRSFYSGDGECKLFPRRYLTEEKSLVQILDMIYNPKPIKQPERPIPYQTPYPTPPTTRPAPEPVRPIPIPPIPIEKVWALRR